MDVEQFLYHDGGHEDYKYDDDEEDKKSRNQPCY